MDILVNAGAVAYGVTLVVATFVRHPLTEAMRIDALFIPHEKVRNHEGLEPLQRMPVAAAQHPRRSDRVKGSNWR